MQSTFRHLAKAEEQHWDRLLRTRADSKPQPARRDPPVEYPFPCVVGRPLPYQCCDRQGRELGTGGVLPSGQVVWLREPFARTRGVRSLPAFTPAVGLVRVEARNLASIRQPDRAKEADHEAA